MASTAAPEGLDRLLALEDIKLIRAKYCRYIDSGQFPRLADILTEDFVLDVGPASRRLGADAPPVAGRAAVLDMMDKTFTPLKQLLHIVTIPEIEFQDGAHATGVWRQETFVKENRPELPGLGFAYATVFDTYRKEDGAWRIASVAVELDLIF